MFLIGGFPITFGLFSHCEGKKNSNDKNVHRFFFLFSVLTPAFKGNKTPVGLISTSILGILFFSFFLPSPQLAIASVFLSV